MSPKGTSLETPTVSILIPVHNASGYLAQTIECALEQTWIRKEIIVVDDGSTDDSYGKAAKYEKHGVTVLQQKNTGASAARNRAFAACRGAFIQYLDADDLLASTKIECQMEVLLKNPNHLASCSWGRFTKVIATLDVRPEPVWRDAEPVDWLVTAWNGGGMMQTACWLTPRALIERAGPWDESLKNNPADDGEFFCRVLLQSSGVRFCRDALVYYRSELPESLSRQITRTAVESLLGNCESYERHMLAKEDSMRARRAVASTYANFLYRIHPQHPDLLRRAHVRLHALGAGFCAQGGVRFKVLSALVGFRRALALRALLRSARHAFH